MPSRPHQARTAASLLNATGHASGQVIAARMLAFSNPAALLSPWHQAEAQRMTSEKLDAGRDGLFSAWAELTLLPQRMLQLAARPSAWTPSGAMNAWTEMAGLWIGVGNAALRPVKSTAVHNSRRLAHKQG